MENEWLGSAGGHESVRNYDLMSSTWQTIIVWLPVICFNDSPCVWGLEV